MESHTQWFTAKSLLDLANEEGSGHLNRIIPALICIEFKQCSMNGKQSGSDFAGEVKEYLWAWAFLQAEIPSSYYAATDQS